MRTFALTLGAAWFLFGTGNAPAADAPKAPFPPEAVEFFETRVRPVFVESCVRCHGEKKQASGLRLDSREAVLEGGENGPAIVPGDPDQSLLIQAIRQTHQDIKMPPKEKLPAPAAQALAAWVKMGAPWSERPVISPETKDNAARSHWAFQPIKSVAPPSVKNQGWGASPVDAFVLARLEGQGMAPSPRADKRTLIRRASFDLIGLPPTAEEVEAFEADSAQTAYEKVIDRLLASPRYGERWGRHWLDVARYADTKGYVFTEERRYPYSYTYRDYVIRSFNDDKPYDQFLVEQIAADRLPAGTDSRSLAALGFLTVGRRFLNNNEDIVDDRIDVVTRGLLGLTVSCARCHDHKFDPIPTDDYYSLFGIFGSSFEPEELPVIQDQTPSAEGRDFEVKLQTRRKERDEFVAAKRKGIEEDVSGRFAAYLTAGYDLKWNGKHPKFDERVKADNLVPSRLRWMMGRWQAHLAATRKAHDPVLAVWHAFAALPAAEFARKAPEVARAFAAADPKAPLHAAVARAFAEKPPGSMAEVVARYGAVFSQEETLRQGLFRAGGPLVLTDETLPRVVERDERNRLRALTKKVDELQATHPGAPPRAMVLNDRPQPGNARVFIRGNPGRPGKEVPRQFLRVLAGSNRKPFQNGSGRLELAQAIASKDNPLTPRVLVNRVWLHHFGQGLVYTASDFGLRSEPPTHPELLDYLAGEFVRSGWSIKALHRTIMLSNTFQQRSENNPVSLERDPTNRLLWKFDRQRLDFEALRDGLLAVSGRLDLTTGGRSVPLTEPPYTRRRAVYGFIDRQNLDGILRTFDFASPDTTSPRRFVTTVPQQALFLMNSPFVIEQARHLAEPEGAPEERIRRLYRQVFARAPEPREVALALRFVQQQADKGMPVPIWQQGWGGFDENSQRVNHFEAFPHWTGTVWQMSAKLPDLKSNYLHLTATGGHPGPGADHSAIRRWTAPHDAVVTIEGTLGHEGKEGDGVRGRIVSSRSGVLGVWLAHHAQVSTPVARLEVKRGDTIDFVVDCRGDEGYDSFTWAPVVRALESAPSTWDSKSGFEAPGPRPLTPWEEYAQVLLLTNEFIFVD